MFCSTLQNFHNLFNLINISFKTVNLIILNLTGSYKVDLSHIFALLKSLNSDSQEDNDDQTKSKPKPIIRPRNEKN